ncbi:hypothetical protein PR202_gb03927 [Eleusine coracana subsp. coracana]|uniref:Uncharacterized protein n=1 Tax=Eleusine coracana subsp. coracana TaxID=191504 RepID=A0AAV5E362_ELECO|nr:hypothetical protein QOZ80_1BG0094740 [Eleusine coracana subsp. coracana]GJN16901.1 hypothetical protein PR202_gb03927 [Eleusine coracana subsp. coracana]
MADAVEALPPPPPPPMESCGGVESGRSSPSPTASPEFEFWMVGKNPSSFPSPALLTADELFSGGVVLPLHTLQAAPSPTDPGDASEAAAEEEAPDSAGLDAPAAEAEEADMESAQQQPLAESNITPTPDLPAVTFKWKDIFKANNNNNNNNGVGGVGGEAKEHRKKAERRVSSVSGNAELININIWPFSRSRSAGHGSASTGTVVSSSSVTTKAKLNNPNTNNVSSNVTTGVAVANNAGAPVAAGSGRKVSSAPCSRSNSRGDSGPEPGVITATAAIPDPAAVEAAHAAPVPGGGPTSMLRRLVPGRNNAGGGGGGSSGIRVGRPSAVWQLRRNKLQQTAAEQQQKQAAGSAKKKAAASAPGLAATDPQTAEKNACEKQAASVSVGCRSNAEEGGPNPTQGLFGLRTFFSKKVY